jgi:hypothetical protein
MNIPCDLLCFIEHFANRMSFNVEMQRILHEPIITCLWWSDCPDLILEPLCKPLIKARCYCLHISAIPFLDFFVTVCTCVPFLPLPPPISLFFQCHSFSCTSLSSFAHQCHSFCLFLLMLLFAYQWHYVFLLLIISCLILVLFFCFVFNCPVYCSDRCS